MHDLAIKKLKNASIHGVSPILMEEKKTMKALWSLLLATAWIVCIHFVLLNIREYFKYEVITSVNTVYEKPFKFPAVTFCNMDPSGYYELSSEELRNLKELIDNQASIMTMMNTAASAINHLFQNRSFNDIYNQSIIYCSFNGKKCTVDDFYINFNPLMGICFKFNGHLQKPTKEMSRPGISNGLIVSFFQGISKLETNGISIPSTSALILNIHENRNMIDRNKVTLIPSNSVSYVQVNKINTVNIPYPYSDCMEINDVKDCDSHLCKMTFQQYGYYQQKYDYYEQIFISKILNLFLKVTASTTVSKI